MEQRIHRRQNDYRAFGPAHAPLPHHRNRQRVFPIQTKRRQRKNQNTAAGKRKILTRRKSGQFVANNQTKNINRRLNTNPVWPTYPQMRSILRSVLPWSFFNRNGGGNFQPVSTDYLLHALRHSWKRTHRH